MKTTMKMNKFKIFLDKRGYLLPITLNELPFKVKRIFSVYNVPKDTIRGNHAHYKTKQFLICTDGKILVSIHNGIEEKKVIINKGEGVLINNMLWDYQKFLTKKSSILVFANTEYDKNDYITNFKDFLKITKNN